MKARRADFWEVCEDRCQSRSLILTSQMPVAKWHEQIGDSAVAEGILTGLFIGAPDRVEGGLDAEEHGEAGALKVVLRVPALRQGTDSSSLSRAPFPACGSRSPATRRDVGGFSAIPIGVMVRKPASRRSISLIDYRRNVIRIRGEH